jgi:hypothetical protein
MAEAVVEDGVPVTAGWFVLNVSDARWLHSRTPDSPHHCRGR